MIQYTLKPVSGLDDIVKANKELIENSEELRSIFFLNCGGSLNLQEILSVPKDVTIFVADVHRPYHLANVHAAIHKVCIVDSDMKASGDDDDDDAVDAAAEKYYDQFPAYIASDDDESDEEEEEEEDDSDDDAKSVKSERSTQVREEGEEGERAVGSGLKSERAEASDGEADEEADDGLSPGRKKRKAARADRREYKKQKRIIVDYYKSTWHGTCSASVMFELAVALNRGRNNLLWNAIIGLTEQYIDEKINADKYNGLVEYYKGHVAKYNAESAREDTTDDGAKFKLGEDDRISSTNELRFMLLRHWSLYESIYHTSYVAARLGIWKAKGRDKLHTFLARMGMPLSAAKQSYGMMPAESKKILDVNKKADSLFQEDGESVKNILEFVAAENLEAVSFESFQMVSGFRFAPTAADMVYSTIALIEMGARSIDDHDEEESTWESRFYQAYDCLQRRSEKCDTLFKTGVENAKRMQQAIVQQAVAMKEKRSVTTISKFRHAMIDNCQDIKIFSNAAALSQLGLFLIETYKAESKKEKPLVLGVLQAEKDAYLVVGINGTSSEGVVRKNMFGKAFRKAADRVGAELKLAGFDSSVVEVSKDHITVFLDHLYTTVADV